MKKMYDDIKDEINLEILEKNIDSSISIATNFFVILIIKSSYKFLEGQNL